MQSLCFSYHRNDYHQYYLQDNCHCCHLCWPCLRFSQYSLSSSHWLSEMWCCCGTAIPLPYSAAVIWLCNTIWFAVPCFANWNWIQSKLCWSYVSIRAKSWLKFQCCKNIPLRSSRGGCLLWLGPKNISSVCSTLSVLNILNHLFQAKLVELNFYFFLWVIKRLFSWQTCYHHFGLHLIHWTLIHGLQK